MGYGTEYLAETEYEREKEIERWETMSIQAHINASHGMWITKDGRYLNVSEMEISHIQNCIRMLERYDSPFKDIYIPMFKKELKKRCKVDMRGEQDG